MERAGDNSARRQITACPSGSSLLRGRVKPNIVERSESGNRCLRTRLGKFPRMKWGKIPIPACSLVDSAFAYHCSPHLARVSANSDAAETHSPLVGRRHFTMDRDTLAGAI